MSTNVMRAPHRLILIATLAAFGWLTIAPPAQAYGTRRSVSRAAARRHKTRTARASRPVVEVATKGGTLKPGQSTSAPSTEPLRGFDYQVGAITNQGPDFAAVIEVNKQTYIVQPGTRVPYGDTSTLVVKRIDPTGVEVADPLGNLVRRALPPQTFRQ